MLNVMLFTDGSVDTKTHVGFGAYLAVNDMMLPLGDLKTQVNVKRFDSTSSTKLELQTLLWAMDDALVFSAEKTTQVVVYSDSQNIVGLLARRDGLEQRDYIASNGKRLNNAELYQQFFMAIDKYTCQLIKVEGHKPQHIKNDVDRVFALVDKASRSALREFNRHIPHYK